MWLDIVVIAIIAICVIVGLWKGFFDSLLGLISTGLAAVVAFTCAKPAATFINKIINLPNWIDGLLTKVIADGEVVSLFGSAKMSFTRIELANFLSIILSAVIVFFVVKIGIWLLAKLFDSVVESSTLGSGLNKLLGGLFGLLKGGAIVVVALLLCSVIHGANIPLVSDFIQTTIDNTKVTSFAYKYVSDFAENQLTKEDLKDFIVDMVKQNQSTETPPAGESGAESGAESGTGSGEGAGEGSGSGE